MQELRANTAVTIRFGPLVDATDGVTAEVGLATALDNATTGLRLSKAGGDYGDRNDATAPLHDEIGEYDVDLSTTDTNTEGILKIDFQNAACVPHWETFMVLSEAAWDAKYLAHPTAQAGAAGTITLASGEVTATNYLNGNLVEIVSGTGAGQAPRVITSSTITTDVCAIAPDWTTNPDATSKYRLIKLQQGVIVTDANDRVDVGAVAGTAQTAGDLKTLIDTGNTASAAVQVVTDALTSAAAAKLALSTAGIISGTAATGTLSTTVMTSDLTGYVDDELIGRTIIWTGGTADGQASDITDYASASGTVTYTEITTAPVNADTFVIV